MSQPHVSSISARPPFTLRLHNLFFLLIGIALGKYHPLLCTALNKQVYRIQPRCQLGRICAWYHRRPLLQNGRVSSPLWDVPRKHIIEQHRIAPNVLTPSSTVRMHRVNPALVWVSNAVTPLQLRALHAAADHLFPFPHVRSHRHHQRVQLPVHQLDRTSATVVRSVLRFLGFATTRYVHRIELRRYGPRSYVHQPTLQRWQPPANLSAAPCALAAVAQLTLRAPAAGGAVTHVWRNASAPAHREHTFRAAMQPRDLLAWYTIHPMTETMPWRFWQRMDRVERGVSLVLEAHIRNCRCKPPSFVPTLPT